MNRRLLIVVADDYGITPEINQGIILGFQQGIITSTALLINALHTEEAIELAKLNPNLEVGLHLSVVEGQSLSGHKDLLDSSSYFPPQPCLHRNWQRFLLQYFKGKINFSNLEDELDQQVKMFLRHYPTIPFINCTQHLHLLPQIQKIVVKLCHRYKVKVLRVPLRGIRPLSLNLRSIQYFILKKLGKKLYRTIQKEKLSMHLPDYFIGFEEGGQLAEIDLCALLDSIPLGVTELMTHPGMDCPFLRNLLSGYKFFNWEGELQSMQSPRVKRLIENQGIKLSNFQQAFTAHHS